MYANHDDDPAALARDARLRGRLADIGVAMHSSKDHVIFEKSEVMTGDGRPYSVYTPYKNAWLKKLEPFYLQAYPVERHAAALAPLPASAADAVPALADIGFLPSNLHELKLPSGSAGGQELLDGCVEQRVDGGEASGLHELGGVGRRHPG